MLYATLGFQFGNLPGAQRGIFDFAALELPEVEQAQLFLIVRFQGSNFFPHSFPLAKDFGHADALRCTSGETIQNGELSGRIEE